MHVSVESLLPCGTSMHPMPCVSCGHANPGTAKFCNECGSPCRKVPSIKVEKSAETIKRLMSFSCWMRLTSFFRKMISSSHPGVQCEARVPCIRRSGCGVVQDPPRARAHGESRAEQSRAEQSPTIDDMPWGPTCMHAYILCNSVNRSLLETNAQK